MNGLSLARCNYLLTECRDNHWDSEFAKRMNLLNVTLTLPHNALHSLQLSCDYQQVAACISVMGTK